jgi:hypothetical protein
MSTTDPPKINRGIQEKEFMLLENTRLMKSVKHYTAYILLQNLF